MNERLIAYLQKQIAEREEQVCEYELAVEMLEEAKARLEEADARVKSFGDIEVVKAEVEEVQGFIYSLTATCDEAECEESDEVCEDAPEVEEAQVEVCAECTVSATPVAPITPRTDVFDEIM